jgi:hypothetical protein
MVIDKEIAETMLLLNTKNRKITDENLTFLKKQMLDNAWVFNAQTISISNENTLLDGQHRLTAVVKTLKEIVSNVSFGVNQNTFSTIDTGRLRYAKDTLFLNGYKSVNHLAAIINYVYRYNENIISKSGHLSTKLTNEKVLEFAKKHSIDYWNGLIKQAMIYYKSNGCLMGLGGAEIASFLYLIKDAEQTKIDNFCRLLFLGLERKEDTFITFLAKKLSDAKKDKLSSIHFPIKMAYLYKAWNMFLDNSKDKQIRYNPDKENYPRLRIS